MELSPSNQRLSGDKMKFVDKLIANKKKLFNLKFQVNGVNLQIAGIGSKALKLKLEPPKQFPAMECFCFISWDKMGEEETDIVEFLVDYLEAPE